MCAHNKTSLYLFVLLFSLVRVAGPIPCPAPGLCQIDAAQQQHEFLVTERHLGLFADGLRLSPDGTWLAVTVSALAADGQSTIGAAHQIDKGYERIDERLRSVGASIERVDS